MQPFPSSDYRSAALSRANTAIARGTRGLPVSSAIARQYTPPRDPCLTPADPAAKAKNLAAIRNFVAGHLKIADGKPAAEARAHLLAWATRLQDDLARLECPQRPAHLVGLTAFDLAAARDALVAEAGRRA